MAEIKSAIELAMERTKDLVIGKEEREAIALKEIETRISAVVRRYLEEMSSAESARKEIDEVKADEGLKRSVLLDALVAPFDVREGNERLFALFDVAGLGLSGVLKGEFEGLRKEFREEMGKRETMIGERIKTSLAALGVRGDGVEPNLKAWDEWKEGMEEAGNVFRNRMKEWKEKVKASNSRS